MKEVILSNTEASNPFFSIILVFRNEAKHLNACLSSFDGQSLSRDKWEIILVDSDSDDGSRAIAEEYVSKHQNSILLDNPEKTAAAGWNLGIKSSTGRYYYPASGHSINDRDYLLEAKRFFDANSDVHALGGRVYNVGSDEVSKAIAAACNTSFALGGVHYRKATEPTRVNVVGLGIYSRELYDALGEYNKNIKRSSDWEFNYRAWSRGYKMFINPAMKAWLFSRRDYKSIFMQQFRTGFWKVVVFAMHRGSLLARHIIPALFVLWLLLFPLFALIGYKVLVAWFIPVSFYAVAAALNCVKATKENIKWYYALIAYPIIHIGYGAGFLLGLFKWRNMFFERDKVVSR